MKLLNPQKLNELQEALKEVCPSLFGGDNYKVSASQENNKLTIIIEEEDYRTDFENYLKTLDDDIFVEACAQYEKRTGQSLSKIKDITPQLINNFKSLVRLVAQMKVDALADKYGL